MAAAISFYTLLSLVPLALLAVSIFGHFLGAEEAHRKVIALVREAIPGSSQALLGAIRVIARKESRWFVHIVGLFGLLWSGMSLLESLSAFLTRAWTGRAGGRTFIGHKLVALAAIAGAGALFLLSVVGTSVVSSLRHHPERLSLISDYLARPSIPIGWTLAFLGSVAMFFLLYRFLPDTQVASRAALVGALLGAVLWHISRALFGMLVASSSRYGQVYGPLAGVVIFMLWIYYSGLILLFCAELAAAYQEEL